MKKFIVKNKYFIIVIMLTIIAFVFRIWRLNQPVEPVFDEVYYPKWANEFLSGQTAFDVHPPMVKLLIALSELVFGNNPIGWRVFPSIFGTLLIPLTYLFVLKLFKNKLTALICAFLIGFDGLYFVLSRIGIMEMFAVFFLILSYYLFWVFLENNSKSRMIWLFPTGIAMGFAITTKWTDLACFGLIYIWLFFYRKDIFTEKENNVKNWILVFLNLMLVPILVYLASFYIWYHGSHDFIQKTLEWHNQAFSFHYNLNTTHPYSSYYWSWPFLIRPVWYYFQNRDGLYYGIIALGNPIIWWTGLVALFWVVFDNIIKKNRAVLFTLGGFLVSYLPWIFIKRIQFNYYYLPSLFFLIVFLGLFLNFLYKGHKKFVYIFLVLVLLMFLFYYPILSSLGVKQSFYELHIWFKSWI